MTDLDIDFYLIISLTWLREEAIELEMFARRVEAGTLEVRWPA